MQPEIPNDDYSHGQMMGMLVVIMMMENALDNKLQINGDTLETIKRVSVEHLAEYLKKPEEDVLLLVTEQLRTI